ncbi:MAG: adenylate/guanylate cyclase domain-containing protein [Candidatus Binataceae bacterium]
MLCPNCKSENPVTNKFCLECGAALRTTCSKCGVESPPQAKFCGNCGGSLEVQIDATSATESSNIADGEFLEGERKFVTALFADIKGSTELSQHIDPETARELIDPALELMIRAVHRFDGYVVQSTGDGIFALFGAPIANEDHPQRALHAALYMQESIKTYAARLQADGKVPIDLRVGAHTGEVVMREVHTGQAHSEYTPIGHVANLASRMQSLAPTGSIAVTEHLRRLCEGYFRFRELGLSLVKGVSDPVDVYEVCGVGSLRTRFQVATERGLTKFVGRKIEIEQMSRVFDLALSGRGQILAAIAEPGVGKSRLFLEFKTTVRQCLVLEGACLSTGKASPYLPLIGLLRSYFGISDEDDERSRSEKITGKVLRLDRTLEDTIPFLLSLLGLALEEHLERRPQESQSAEEPEKVTPTQRTIDAVKRVIIRESLNQPIILVFEDLHWIDNATQDFINLLADSIGSVRVLLLVNYRPEYTHGWSNKTYYTQLRLDPFGAEPAHQILSSLVGDGEDLLPLKQLIVRKTEGNPFFIEEIVRNLFDEGTLVRNGAVELAQPISTIQIPETVQGILAYRIDRLDASEKDHLQTMAVIGRESSLALLVRVTGKSELELRRLVYALQLAEFVYEQPTLNGTEYVFKHAFTQEVAYNSVLLERRRLLHGKIGAAIETLHEKQAADYANEVARHYGLSANKEKELDSLYYAGTVAESRAAYTQAISYLTKALHLLDSSSRESSAKEDLRFEVLIHLGCSQANDGEPRLGNRSICVAAELAKRRADTRRFARAVLQLRVSGGETNDEAISLLGEALDRIGSEDTAEKALVMSWLSFHLTWSQQLVRARGLAKESILLARRLGDKPTLLWVLKNAVSAFHILREVSLPDDVQERIALGLEAQSLADELHEDAAAWSIACVLMEGLQESGEVQSANEQLARLVHLAEKSTARMYQLALARAKLAMMAGLFEEGRRLAYEAVSLGQQAHEARVFEYLGLQLAILYYEEGHLGDLEEAFKSNVQANPNQPSFRCALAMLYVEQANGDHAVREFESLAKYDFRDLPRYYNWLIGIALVARVCEFLGDPERAGLLYNLMLPYRRRNVVVAAVSLGSAELYLGLLAATMSRFEEAQTHFEAALELNARMGALPWVAHTQYDFARMLLKRAHAGDRQRGIELLAAARETAQRLRMSHLCNQTATLMSELAN